MKRWQAILGGAIALASGGALATFLVRRHAPPPTCATRCADGTPCGEDAADGFHKVQPPVIPGFRLRHADFDDALGVALATDAQHRTVLMGFDIKTRRVSFSASLAADKTDDPDPARVPHVLVQKRWFAAYGVPGRAQHAVAFDALTGQRLWDRALPGDRAISSLRVADHLLLFVPDDGSAPLAVDRATGKSP